MCELLLYLRSEGIWWCYCVHASFFNVVCVLSLIICPSLLRVIFNIQCWNGIWAESSTQLPSDMSMLRVIFLSEMILSSEVITKPALPHDREYG